MNTFNRCDGRVSVGLFLVAAVFTLGSLMFFKFLLLPGTPFQGGYVFGAASSTVTASTTVVVGNSAPTVSSVTINGGSDIVLTPNATTSVSVSAVVSDNNGCAEILNGTTTIMAYRSGITSSTCIGAANNLNCYVASAFTATSSCQNSVTLNTTTTFDIYYFAQATDASSSFPSQNWLATVRVTDVNGEPAVGTALDSAGVELLTLTALNVTTSSINYGTLSASSTTGATNQVTTSTNAGNSSTTLQLRVLSTLASGSNVLPTSTTQTFSTSTFTFQGTSTFITDTNQTVNGFLLTSPTSTTNVADEVYWGMQVFAGTATGTYTGVNLFSSLFQP